MFVGREIPYFPNMQKTSKQKQVPYFLMIQERSYSSMVSFGKTIFSEHLKKISYFNVFNIHKTSFFHVIFEKDHLSFCAQRMRSLFLEEKISSFLMVQETSYSRAIYLERLFFQNIWKKNMVFRAVQVLWAKHCHHIWSNLCHDMSYSIAETTRLW